MIISEFRLFLSFAWFLGMGGLLGHAVTLIYLDKKGRLNDN